MPLPALAAYRTLIQSSARGFTLIELLLVIAIIGILSALVMPGMNGIYNRQVLDNTAKEIVTSIKQAHNRALSNDQDKYVGSQSEYVNDCTPSKPYIEYQVFRVTSVTAYQAQRQFKVASNSGASCSQPSTPSDIGVMTAKTLPDGLHFASNDTSWVVRYQSTTGALNTINPTNPTDTTRTFYTLTSSHVAGLTYYICVTQGGVYAQQDTACW